MQLAVPAGATFSPGKLGEPSHFFQVAPAIEPLFTNSAGDLHRPTAN
jgi:hypothetical protein